MNRPDPERPSGAHITSLLRAWAGGEPLAPDRLLPIVYGDLRRRAAALLRHERPDHTLQAGDLVHEAFLRLSARPQPGFESRGHFFAIAARVMRQVLVDHARAHKAAKRSGGRKLDLDAAGDISDERARDMVALDEALDVLAKLDPEKVQLVELRFFAGLSIEETAEVLDVSPAKVKRDWSLARAFLHRELRGDRSLAAR